MACAKNEDARLQHMETASQAGAVAFVIDSQAQHFDNLSPPTFQMDQLARQRGPLAAFYEDPSHEMTCIGVTGTNGKTSIAYFGGFWQSFGGADGYSGTLGWGTPQDLVDSAMTTASPVFLQKQLAAMAHRGMKQVALEVSSMRLIRPCRLSTWTLAFF